MLIRTRNSSRASEISRVKPVSPLLACMCVGLKPPSPLRVSNGRFWCSCRAQRCRRFHVGPYQRLQRCHWFHSRHVAVSCARKSSPCVLRKARNRLFMACWAIFSRQCRSRGCVGRILSRCRPDASHVGRTLSRRWRCWHAMRLYVGLARRAANRPQPGRSRLGVIAANEPPALASCGGRAAIRRIKQR